MRSKFQSIVNCEGGHNRGGGNKDRQQERQVEGGGAQGGRGEGQLDFPEKRFLNISSGGEVGQVCEGGEGEAAQLVVEQQEQEVNLRPRPLSDRLFSTIS